MRQTAQRFFGGTLRPSSMKWAACAGVVLMTALLMAAASAATPCGSWGVVATPNVGNQVTRLTAVSALAADDAWSVGHWRNATVGHGPVVLHWDGAIWSPRDLPATDALGTSPDIAGVAAAPNGDVWVVGNVTTPYPTLNLPLVIRWRDGAWHDVAAVTLRPQTVHPFAARGGLALEVAAIADDDIWAVGSGAGFGDGQATSVPLAIHFDGSEWTDVEVPSVSNRHHQLNDVVALAHDDVWAVGDYRNVAGPYRAITYHWDGSSWSHIPSPIEDLPNSSLEDIAAAGPNDIWAVGNAADAGVILMHWDGSRWSLVQSPPNSGGSLAAAGPDDLWLSGWNGFWHWDGAIWTEVPAVVPGAAYVIRSGGMAIVGGCDIWCMGFGTLADGITSSTLAERLSADMTATPESRGDSPATVTAITASPNPFNPQTTVQYELAEPGAVTLRVCDLRGRVVRSLLTAVPQAIGRHEIRWDGRGDDGGELPSGTYLLHIVTADTARSLRVAMIR